MSLPLAVTIREVGPRDGIQSLGAFIPTAQKIDLVNVLAASGLKRIESTSFVHPKLVPQMADSEQVMTGIVRRPGVSYEVLVPNMVGARRALGVSPDRLILVLAASDAFNLKNIRMTVEDSLQILLEVKQAADDGRVPLSLGVATSFGCPYSGDVPVSSLERIIARALELDIAEIGLADTTGMANPRQVEHTMAHLRDRFPSAEFGLHFHNTRGMGLANVVAGLRAGITVYDASIGGIGGCPFAPRATGNISTEDTVHMLHEMGIPTGIDLDALIEAARLAEQILGRELPGQVMKAGKRSDLAPV